MIRFIISQCVMMMILCVCVTLSLFFFFHFSIFFICFLFLKRSLHRQTPFCLNISYNFFDYVILFFIFHSSEQFRLTGNWIAEYGLSGKVFGVNCVSCSKSVCFVCVYRKQKRNNKKNHWKKLTKKDTSGVGKCNRNRKNIALTKSKRATVVRLHI